jgi:hypothetical protein
VDAIAFGDADHAPQSARTPRLDREHERNTEQERRIAAQNEEFFFPVLESSQ